MHGNAPVRIFRLHRHSHSAPTLPEIEIHLVGSIAKQRDLLGGALDLENYSQAKLYGVYELTLLWKTSVLSTPILKLCLVR